MSSMQYDLIIIGAGPAGSAAAINALQAGLKVCLVERECLPRHRPGETLHPGIEPLLKQLGVWEKINCSDFIRHAGIKVNWGGQTKFHPYSSSNNETWLGIQARREVFDLILLEQAKAFGADVKENLVIDSLTLNEDKNIISLTTTKEILTARYLIDASGSWQWLARKYNISFQHYSPQLFCRYGYVHDKNNSTYGEIPNLYSDDNGWLWVAKIGTDLYQWTRLNWNGQSPKMSYPIGFSRSATTIKVAGADVTWRIAKQPSWKHFFLVGDAAAILDPASSHGVLRAIMTGIYASYLIVQQTQKEFSDEMLHQEYASWLRNWFKHDVTKLNEFYQTIKPDWTNSTAQHVMSNY